MYVCSQAKTKNVKRIFKCGEHKDRLEIKLVYSFSHSLRIYLSPFTVPNHTSFLLTNLQERYRVCSEVVHMLSTSWGRYLEFIRLGLIQIGDAENVIDIVGVNDARNFRPKRGECIGDLCCSYLGLDETWSERSWFSRILACAPEFRCSNFINFLLGKVQVVIEPLPGRNLFDSKTWISISQW